MVEIIIRDETIWITQKAMAELFGVKVPAISKHLKNIFADEELDEKVVVSKMEIATPHGAIPGKHKILQQIITVWMQLFQLDIELILNRQRNSGFGRRIY